MNAAYVRGYFKKVKEPIQRKYNFAKRIKKDSSLIFVFDTETTIDTLQNLKVGYYTVLDKTNNTIIEVGFFYDENYCSKTEIEHIFNYCKNKRVNIFEKSKFMLEVFYNYILRKGALCVGFNLPFDFSRISIDATTTKGKKFHNGFSFKLTENKAFPRLKIKSNGNAFSLIQFGSSIINKGRYYYGGRFLDLHTLTKVLTGKHLSLKNACEKLNVDGFKQETEHGNITQKYLKYLENDVLITLKLYQALVKEYELYCCPKPPEQLFTQATMGKSVLDQMNIKKFSKLNPEFPEEILGLLMNAYYGGRSEVKCREDPIKISLLDFTSMYPTVNILCDMQKYLLAKKIKVIECTEEIKNMLSSITIQDLQKPAIWKQMNAICILKPQDDIFPLRTTFNKDEQGKNIGICSIDSQKRMSYSLADVIGSKILSGKIPQIIKAYKFIPEGKQVNLKAVNLLGSLINPKKDDIFKTIVLERQRAKKEMANLERNTDQFRLLNSKQLVLKFISNSTCYGIFVESHPEFERSNVEVYGLDEFIADGVFEDQGIYFNPIMAVTITSTSRLLLSIIEVLLREQNEQYAFCDTDSMAVPIDTVNMLQEYFKPLNPYGEEIELLKEERHNVWFYGISAKRYCLFEKEGNNIKILKPSLHGLGHLLNPFSEKTQSWHKTIWETILKLHYNIMSKESFTQSYGSLFAVTQMKISNQEIMKRVKTINKGKPYDQRIKPYGFVSVGTGTKKENGKHIKPITPFNRNTQITAREEFMDSQTGKKLKGTQYWKTLNRVIEDYIEHPESKLEGEKGYLKRRHIKIDSITIIGKEAKKVYMEPLGITPATEFHNKEELFKKILEITNKEAKKKGVTRPTLWKIKEKIRTGKNINLKTSAVRKLLGS